MSLSIVDKRVVTRDRTAENRQRFLRRVRGIIKDQLPDLIAKRGIKDMAGSGGKVRINKKTIREPWLHHDEGGDIDKVVSGNDQYVPGDLIDKPMGSGGGMGRQAGRGQSEDDFVVELSRDEFLDYFFEDLELPDMMKTELSKVHEIKRENAGFQPDGPQNRLSLIRSYKNSLARRIALKGGIDQEVAELEEQIAKLMAGLEVSKLDMVKPWLEDRLIQDAVNPATEFDREADEKTVLEIVRLQERIAEIKERRENLPLFEDVDLRFRTQVKREIPSAHATMVMIMDNSGSMGRKEKTIARKFFWLLYSFLSRAYDDVDLVFISHTDEAHEMDEDEFFNTRESGGTIVSTALDLTTEIIKERLLGKTNIYVAQVSDGDNDSHDNGTCSEILEDDILPNVRYMAYVQVDQYHMTEPDDAKPTISGLLSYEKGLWQSYSSVSKRNPKLQARRVFEEADIYPVFHGLFQKKV